MEPKNKPLRSHDNGGRINGPVYDMERTFLYIRKTKFQKLLVLSAVMGFVFGFWVGFLYHGGF